MNNNEINEEIKKLLKLQYLNNAKTKDGVQIEEGKTYYTLENLSEGFKEFVVNENCEFTENGIYNHNNKDRWNYSQYSNYDKLFSSKKNALNYMKEFLNQRIKTYENNIESAKRSLELLKKLKV